METGLTLNGDMILVLIVILLLREVRLNERQSNFISAVTHELKTPLTNIRMYAELLEADLEPIDGEDAATPGAVLGRVEHGGEPARLGEDPTRHAQDQQQHQASRQRERCWISGCD